MDGRRFRHVGAGNAEEVRMYRCYKDSVVCLNSEVSNLKGIKK